MANEVTKVVTIQDEHGEDAYEVKLLRRSEGRESYVQISFVGFRITSPKVSLDDLRGAVEELSDGPPA